MVSHGSLIRSSIASASECSPVGFGYSGIGKKVMRMACVGQVVRKYFASYILQSWGCVV